MSSATFQRRPMALVDLLVRKYSETELEHRTAASKTLRFAIDDAGLDWTYLSERAPAEAISTFLMALDNQTAQSDYEAALNDMSDSEIEMLTLDAMVRTLTAM